MLLKSFRMWVGEGAYVSVGGVRCMWVSMCGVVWGCMGEWVWVYMCVCVGMCVGGHVCGWACVWVDARYN